jgi:hypothetical protein
MAWRWLATAKALAKSATATFPNTPSVSALVRRLKKKGENGLGNFLGFQMQIL